MIGLGDYGVFRNPRPFSEKDRKAFRHRAGGGYPVFVRGKAQEN
jgi:hypothetical protein